MADQGKKPPTPAGSEGEDHVYGKAPGAGDWRRVSKLVLLVVLVVFVVLFFLGNRETVEVSLVVATVSIPLVVVLVGTFLSGALVMYLLLLLRRRAARKARVK